MKFALPRPLFPEGLSKQAWTWRVALLLLLCRLPFLVWIYPGSIFPDTATSIEQFHGYADFTAQLAGADASVVLTNHHPVIYTLLYGGTIRLGTLVGNQGLAVFLLLLAQALLQSWLTARLLCLLRGRMRRPVRLAAWFYALMPIYGWWSALMVKDAFFSLTTTWLTLLLVAVAETRGRIAARRKFAVAFFAVLLLFMLSKNQCQYICMLLLAFVALFGWRRRRHLAVPVLSAIVCYRIFLGLLPTWHIALSGRQEAMGFLFQQTARYVHDHPGDVTEQEREAVAAILPYDSLARLYDPDLQDPVKFRYNPAADEDDFRHYLAAWASMGRKHPATYLRSLWDNCGTYFYPSGRFPMASLEFTPLRPDVEGLYDLHPLFPRWPGGFAAVLRVPVVRLLFDMGFYVPLLLLLGLLMAARRDRAALLVALPALVSVGVLVVSPQNGCFRYVMPIVWTLPAIAVYALRPRRPDPVGTPRAGEDGQAGRRKLSVLVPAYNEAATVGTLLGRLADVKLPDGFEKEIIVIDDASTDATAEKVEAFRRERPDVCLTLVRHARNGGKGTAIRTGIAQATGEYTVVQDADLEYEPADLARLLAHALSEGANVVYGSRFLRRENRHSYATFYWGGRLVSWTANALYGLRLTDEPTCYKLLRTGLLRSLPLRCRGFEFCPEVTALVALNGHSIPEIPISYTPRSMAEGKKIGWRDGVEALWTLLRLRLFPPCKGWT